MVGTVPNEKLYFPPVSACLMEYAEGWSVSRASLSQESIAAMLLDAA